MTNDSILSYPSNFLSDINITIIFKENENYDTLKKQFETYGYGFLIPNIKTIIIMLLNFLFKLSLFNKYPDKTKYGSKNHNKNLSTSPLPPIVEKIIEFKKIVITNKNSSLISLYLSFIFKNFLKLSKV